MSFVIIVSTLQNSCDVEVIKYRKKSQNKLIVSVYKNPNDIIIGEKSE